VRERWRPGAAPGAPLLQPEVQHDHLQLDDKPATVEFLDCGERMDQIQVLLRFARQDREVVERQRRMKEINEKLNVRVRTKCENCCRMTVISGL